MNKSTIISSMNTRSSCAYLTSEGTVLDFGVSWINLAGKLPRDVIDIWPIFSRAVFKRLALF